jgi:hypothetical protein
MADSMDKSIKEAVRLAEELREKLFVLSQNAMRDRDTELSSVERLFSVIKQAEQLRRDIENLMSEHQLNNDQVWIPHRLIQEEKRNSWKYSINSSEYPRYLVREDSLVRLGKGQHGPYEHVVKKADLDRIILALNDFVGSKTFSVDEVLKKLDLPSYLTYTVVSVLKDGIGKLESPKRGRYRFKHPQPLSSADVIEAVKNLGSSQSV